MNREATFAELVAGREREFPLLALAAADTRLALDTKLEWLQQNDGGLYTVANYTQIVRDKTVDDLLTSCERILRYGKPTVEGFRGTCGGVLHYLGREPQEGDVVRLRPLREPTFSSHSRPFLDEPDQWLTEFSLQVIPADQRERAAA